MYEEIYDENVGIVRVGPHHQYVVILKNNGEFGVWKVAEGDYGRDLIPKVYGTYKKFVIDYKEGKIIITTTDGNELSYQNTVCFWQEKDNICLLMA